jgi:hypothetical protein
VLATQNPVDLDYKGLANTGTWFIGKLQTERDRARCSMACKAPVGSLDRADRKAARWHRQPRLLAARRASPTRRSCSKRAGRCRICAARSTRERNPARQRQSRRQWQPHRRWQPRRRCGGNRCTGRECRHECRGHGTAGAATGERAPGAKVASDPGLASAPPVLSSDVPQVFLPVHGAAPANAVLVYVPQLLGSASVALHRHQEWCRSGACVRGAGGATRTGRGRHGWTRSRSPPPWPVPRADDSIGRGTLSQRCPPMRVRRRTTRAGVARLTDWLFRNATVTLLRCTQPVA